MKQPVTIIPDNPLFAVIYLSDGTQACGRTPSEALKLARRMCAGEVQYGVGRNVARGA